MLLSELRFCSLLSYSTRGEGSEHDRARAVRTAVKRDSVGGEPPRPMSQRIAQYLASRMAEAGLSAAFGDDVCLVPVPRSALTRPGDLWVPLNLVRALRAVGLAGCALPLLRRTTAVPKAATSPPGERPLPINHFESLAVDARLLTARRILLVDDVVTRGATLLGAASRLAEVYPSTPIAAFAAMRAVSDPADYRDVVDPQSGLITLRPQGDTLRRP